MEKKYKDLLRSNHIYICSNVNLKDSNILDKLQEDMLISSDEAEEIINFKFQNHQTSQLLYKLKRKDSSKKPFQLFIKALESSHPFVSNKLLKDLVILNGNVDLSNNQDVMCINCFLLENLYPLNLSQKLYENEAFSDDELEDINNPNRSRRSQVQLLLSILSKTPSKKVIKIFKEYIQETFECALKTSDSDALDEFLICRCERNKTNNAVIDGQIQSNSKQLTTLSKNVPKNDPNSSKIIWKLRDLWNEFWYLREQGNWSELRARTDATFNKYKRNPDVIFFLYRSEMCTSTFYLEDKEKADTAYQKALDLHKKTSIPNWHLGRLFALRIYMCTRDGNLAEAQKLITQGQQELNCLAPCLATGTLLFFEGLYYSEFLRRHSNGSKAHEIFERSKKSFLLAIEHYAEERLFAVETWRDEIYLFLPLLEMHVDFKKLNTIDIQRSSNIDFILVRHYLDLFENECLGRATTWSKMMYNIARAKQHEFAENYARCVDYFRQAKHFAEEGEFVDQSQTIGELIDKLSDRLPQQQGHQCQRRHSLSSGNSSPIFHSSSTESDGQ